MAHTALCTVLWSAVWLHTVHGAVGESCPTFVALAYFSLYSSPSSLLLHTELTAPFSQGALRAEKHYRLHAHCIFKLHIWYFGSHSLIQHSVQLTKVYVHGFAQPFCVLQWHQMIWKYSVEMCLICSALRVLYRRRSKNLLREAILDGNKLLRKLRAGLLS